MSRYETGIHEPPIAIAEKIANALNVPLPYFYCDDEQLAEILLHYAAFNARKKTAILDFAKEISQSD
jgi:transcriptional regulator with XRE-family HTH domain